MLLIARGGREAAARIKEHAATLRAGSGVVVAVVAIGLVFHVDDQLAKWTPGYTNFLQDKIENSASAARELAKVRGGKAPLKAVRSTTGGLPDYGVAPPLKPDGAWINSKPLTLAQLRGKVVLVDFWTYSCINCLRTLPHLKAWYAAYHKEGLVIVGVHTPEFAFEHVTSNVRSRGEAARHHLPGRPGQPLQDLGQLREPVLARRVPDRQDRATSGTRTSARASTARPRA